MVNIELPHCYKNYTLSSCLVAVLKKKNGEREVDIGLLQQSVTWYTIPHA